MDSLASAGVVAIGRMLRAGGLVGILDPRSPCRTPSSGSPPRSCTRSRSRSSSGFRCSRTSERRRGRMRLKRTLLVALTASRLHRARRPRSRRGDFDPSDEFKLNDWVPIHLGPLDMSINKAVVYLLLGARSHLRDRDPADALAAAHSPGPRQTVGEMIYDIAQTQVAEMGLPTKAIGRWFPYVATLMIFICVDQHPRLHPAAAHRRDLPRRPGLGHLRGDVVDLRDARARADDLDLPAHRGHPLQRRDQVLQVVDPRGAEGDPSDDHRRSRCSRSSCA